ncbi:hypothetical protein ACRN9G_18835 [Shewanella frigidimarina]|uniref:hypothetical protein n=1 Tax=Shewanella frigidimarina TaxID=56812 RepID=UPI003D7A512A
MSKQQVIFSAIIVESNEKGVGNEDHLYSWQMDSSPERTEIEVMPIDCNKETFIDALLNSNVGRCFVSYRSGRLADIGGCGLSLEKGQEIKIFNNFTVTN